MAKNNKDQIILTALLTYPTIREASEAIGIPESTIYSKLRNEDFERAYQKAKDDLLQNTTTFLQSQLQEATKTIIEIMNDKEVAAQTRLNAARSVFDYCIKLTERAENLKRIEEAESIMNNEWSDWSERGKQR